MGRAAPVGRASAAASRQLLSLLRLTMRTWSRKSSSSSHPPSDKQCSKPSLSKSLCLEDPLLIQQQQVQNEQSFSSSSSGSLSTLFGSGHEVSVSGTGGEHSYTGQVSSDGSVGK